MMTSDILGVSPRTGTVKTKMSAPCALIASCTDLHPKELVKQILGVSELSSGEHLLEQIEAYPWHVDTKYYDAHIRLCTTETRTFGDEAFAEAVQACIIYFDTKKEESFKLVHSWLPFLKEMDPSVLILVCDRCKESDVVSRQRILSWCLEHTFELVELDPEDDAIDGIEDDFQETVGVKRIIQALHAHPWPNLIMKEKPTFRSPLMNQLMAAESNTETESDADSEHSAPYTVLSDSETPGDDITHHTGTPGGDITNDTVTPGGEITHHTVPPSAESVDQSQTDSLPNMEALTINTQDLNENDSSVTNRNDTPNSISEAESESPGQSSEQASAGATDKVTKELRNKEAKQAQLSSPGETEGAVGGESVLEQTKEQKKKKNEEQKQKKGQGGLVDLMLEDDMQLFSALGREEEQGAESFEQLFDNMRRLKEKAESLPPDQRKQYAEQVAIQFWRAIGGEEEEIEGLTDSDED